MSFILDALKKSESDRQRQSGPSLFEVKVAPPRRALPVWAVAIAVLLAVNVVVISWMFLRHGAAQRPAAAKAPAAAPAAQAASAAAAARAVPARARGQVSGPAGSPAPSGPARQPSTAGGTAPSGAAAQIPAPAPSAAPPAASAPAAATEAAPAPLEPNDYAPAVQPAATQGSGAAAGALPLYRQVVATDGLPELHLDLHVYARNPKDRFVMINMHKLVEGASLPSGVRVDAIRPDGVVLSYHGTQFLLPRD
ncbi:MAG: general secretion pathway protein GspB [Proteobacteria bacterium]|nr:general secretion pathway protein GspB [Pseudomonadota bacterium]